MKSAICLADAIFSLLLSAGLNGNVLLFKGYVGNITI